MAGSHPAHPPAQNRTNLLQSETGTVFCQALSISRDGDTQPTPVFTPHQGKTVFLYILFQFPLLKFAAVCLSSSCCARPSRAWLPSLLQPPIRELTTAIDQVLQPPQRLDLLQVIGIFRAPDAGLQLQPQQCWEEREKITSLDADQCAFCLLAGTLNMSASRTLATISAQMLLWLGSLQPVLLHGVFRAK